MRAYTADKYFEYVEKFNDPVFQSWQKTEGDVIFQVKNSKSKTFIDLGAGYGRVLRVIASAAKNVLAIEINPGMLEELRRRSMEYNNVKVMGGDIQNLLDLLESEEVKNPVLLLLQNTLGTVEGDYKKVLSEMKKVATQYRGEIIISLLRQEALKDFGMKLYTHIAPMTGDLDLGKTDFEKGLFVSKTGYESKWWTLSDIEEIRKYFGGKVIKEVKTPEFYILHTSLT